MRQIIKLVLIFTLLAIAFNQTSYCNVPGSSNQITLDQGTSVVCLHVFLNSTQYAKTYAFKLNVDYFQALVINNLTSYINNEITTNKVSSVSFQVQFQNSPNQSNKTILIYNKTANIYRDILSFIIIVQDGAFTQITLDNQKCDTLGQGLVCYQNQGFSPISADGKYPGKDPRFFVSWMGTDIKKNHFISHTRRLSRYSSFSVGSIWNDAKNVINA